MCNRLYEPQRAELTQRPPSPGDAVDVRARGQRPRRHLRHRGAGAASQGAPPFPAPHTLAALPPARHRRQTAPPLLPLSLRLRLRPLAAPQVPASLLLTAERAASDALPSLASAARSLPSWSALALFLAAHRARLDGTAADTAPAPAFDFWARTSPPPVSQTQLCARLHAPLSAARTTPDHHSSCFPSRMPPGAYGTQAPYVASLPSDTAGVLAWTDAEVSSLLAGAPQRLTWTISPSAPLAPNACPQNPPPPSPPGPPPTAFSHRELPRARRPRPPPRRLPRRRRHPRRRPGPRRRRRRPLPGDPRLGLQHALLAPRQAAVARRHRGPRPLARRPGPGRPPEPFRSRPHARARPPCRAGGVTLRRRRHQPAPCPLLPCAAGRTC